MVFMPSKSFTGFPEFVAHVVEGDDRLSGFLRFELSTGTETLTDGEGDLVLDIPDPHEVAFLDTVVGIHYAGPHAVGTVGKERDRTHVDGYEPLHGLVLQNAAYGEERFLVLDESDDVVAHDYEIEISALGTPDELKKAAQNGNVQNLLSNMSPMQAQQIQKILSDENAAKKLLSTPQAQELLRRLSKNE